jgi:hypothetical protein
MAKTKTGYIDACCIIEALKKKRGLTLSHPVAEVDMIERIMRAAREGDIELFTSMITVAEVVHLGEKPPPADLKPLVERLILSGRDGITSIATSPQIVELARDWPSKKDFGTELRIGFMSHQPSPLEYRKF